MKKTIAIEGMTCGHCVARVKAALSGVRGVARADVDLGEKRATVEGADLEDGLLEAAVAEAGYRVVGLA